MFQPYQTIELLRDINPMLKIGMKGVILGVWDEETVEVEFLDNDGYNIEYNGQVTFTLKAKDVHPC
ncbi:hypothetical protein [Flavisolibacter tropicus]|uniref:DUF4926 domain-containing protein n=1 Tax=Flavisolibacter tropicus TaxID=1492898 RepID=A0A172TSI1_9BACT|nr:hypothetical protein [Flavisolibacter tropicus]ANE49956.1 hypothetical protein SY85_05035 [Flavisolibacter tropicus]